MAERYLMVEAVADADGAPRALVTDPEGAHVRRFVGVERDPAFEGEPEFRKQWRPCKHVRKAHHDLLSAVKAGDLKQHGPLVSAASREDAERHITAALKGAEPAATKAKKEH